MMWKAGQDRAVGAGRGKLQLSASQISKSTSAITHTKHELAERSHL